jgi:nitric oxide reductase NorD protein
MGGIEFDLWEPEESVGKIWHAFASDLDAPAEFPDAAVTLEEMRARLAVFYRGLGGARDVEIKPAALQESRHRLSRLRTLGQSAERLALPSFDGEVLRLPARIASYPDRDANIALYLWLAAASAHAIMPLADVDPLRADIRALQSMQHTALSVLSECPGLRRLHSYLASATGALRRDRGLPATEAALEAAISHLLGGPLPDGALARQIAAAARGGTSDLSAFAAPRGYRTFMPVPLWPDFLPLAERQRADRDAHPPEDSVVEVPEQEQIFRAKRKNADEAARKDSLILHKFEAILSWTEFINLNRRIDDDDEDAAKKAADDQDEIALTRVPQKARRRLKLHLDLSPEDAEFERISGRHVYPEWDHRTKTYLPDYCRVLAGPADLATEIPQSLKCASARRRIKQVRRQFEALRPKRVHLTRQVDGEDIDVEAAVDARVVLAATGEHSDRVYRASRAQERDLAVSILLDASRSSESTVAGRQVIDIAREALIALAWGLHSCGDETAIEAFSSLLRDRVFVHSCKAFDEPMGPAVESRIAGLRPGHYTRLGAAVRHASSGLAARARQRRLLLVITDGKPNDLDHYEGRHGIEDTHFAVREARRSGQSVFGVTIDAKSQATFSRIFGRGGFVVIPDPEKLTEALPQLYRHLVGA